MEAVTDWNSIAVGLGYHDEKELWSELYTNDKASIAALAETFRCSPNQIRDRVRGAGIELRGQGGANYKKISMNAELALRCDQEGCMSVSRHMGVSYTALLKAHKAFRASVQAGPESGEQSPRSSPSPTHPEHSSSSESPQPGQEGSDSSQTAKGGTLGS
jgi:transposase-like protein